MTVIKLPILIEEVDIALIETRVIEEANKPNIYMIKGPFMEADQQNRNKRVYPHQVLQPQVEAYQAKIKGHRAVGELNHPNNMEINPENIAIKIEKLEWSNKHTVYGEAKVCSTPKGMILRSLMDEKIKFGVSSRGAGTLKEGIVQGDYRYVGNDVVWDPSARSAMVENLVEAKTEWVLENGILCEKQLEDIQDGLNDFKGKTSEEVIIESFEKILTYSTKNYISKL